jgi:exonuclease VII small subunit
MNQSWAALEGELGGPAQNRQRGAPASVVKPGASSAKPAPPRPRDSSAPAGGGAIGAVEATLRPEKAEQRVVRRAEAVRRMAAGVAAPDIAMLLGVHVRTVYKWRQRSSGPDPVAKLADAPRPGRPRSLYLGDRLRHRSGRGLPSSSRCGSPGPLGSPPSGRVDVAQARANPARFLQGVKRLNRGCKRLNRGRKRLNRGRKRLNRGRKRLNRGRKRLRRPVRRLGRRL